MLLKEMNWMDVERYLETDDRMVFVTGAVEAHGYLSILSDANNAYEMAKKACELERVILAPPLYFGLSHFAMDYPGSITLSVETYGRVIKDLLNSVLRHGFKRILFINGHGANETVLPSINEVILDRPDVKVDWQSWFLLPKTYKKLDTEPYGGWVHAAWGENFPFNRVGEVPDLYKEPVHPLETSKPWLLLSAQKMRELLGDCVSGGAYTLNDDERMIDIFETAVEEFREMIQNL